jgi:hypothetical protein
MDETAKALATHFYRELAVGHPVPDALRHARETVKSRFPDVRLEDLPGLVLKSDAHVVVQP